MTIPVCNCNSKKTNINSKKRRNLEKFSSCLQLAIHLRVAMTLDKKVQYFKHKLKIKQIDISLIIDNLIVEKFLTCEQLAVSEFLVILVRLNQSNQSLTLCRSSVQLHDDGKDNPYYCFFNNLPFEITWPINFSRSTHTFITDDGLRTS